MSRYIDASKIVLSVTTAFDPADHEVYIPLAAVRAAIAQAPTADVREIRRGRWIEQVKIRKDGKPRLVHWQCSLCGVFLGTNTANFCPHCGAKMDLKDE
nr:MAG TPA: zinc-ribbon containing domain protein [Caudoviricetes sp.]